MKKAEMLAYNGKMLRINLTSGEIEERDYTDQYQYSDWLGHIAVKLLYEELPSWVTPFDPYNRLIFSTGVFMGTTVPGACKVSASTLGPLTGGWASGSCDSYAGMEMKHAGYDHLVIQGRAHRPSYLWITDETVEIRDATELWGKTTWETLDLIREELNDPTLHVLSIGPAGENLARNACIIQDWNRAIGRCGTGAVMGSKNLKAIVCKGKKSINVADVEKFGEKVFEIRERINNSPHPETEYFKKYGSLGANYIVKQDADGVAYKNFQEGRWPDDIYPNLDMRKIIDKYEVAKRGFPGCAIRCSRAVRITEGPYKGLECEINQWEVMGGLMAKCCIKEPTFAIKYNALCSQMGMDVDGPSGAIAWAMECFDRGILTKEDTGGIEINWGDEEVVLDLTRKMCYREGFGNILAEGCYRAASIIGRGSEKYAIHIKKQDLYETLRGTNGWALGAMTASRGGGHTTGSSWWGLISVKIDDETAYKLLGIPNFSKARDPLSYEGTVDEVYYNEILHRICNSTGICLYNTVMQDFDFINLQDIAELLTYATGKEYTVKDLETIAMRQLNMEKAFNLKFTDFSRKDDMPQDRHFEPIPTGPNAGWTWDKGKVEEMLDEYYEKHGWSKETSFPKKETYEKYGLGEVVHDMEKMGKLG